MSDVQMALGGASFDGLVTIEEVSGHGMITLRGDLSDKTVVKAVKDVFGVALPATRGAGFERANGALWMSPDEALLL